MMYETIIIGGGPAGVAAGIYAARKKIKSILITKDFGGQSINSSGIENFIGFKKISGLEFSKLLEEHLKAQDGIEIQEGVTVESIIKNKDFFEVKDSKGNIYESKTILYAAGSGYKKLNIPGEKEFEGKGVFYCTICDAPLLKNKPAAVIGGGNSGLESAIDLLPYASKIYILDRNPALKGDPIYQERLKKESKVEIILNSRPKEIIGDVMVKGLRYENIINQEEESLDVSGVFVAIGHKPNSDLVKDIVKLDEFGHIIVDPKTQKTSLEGFWAAGDVTDSLYPQINIAIGDGVRAILNIYDYLNKNK